MLVNTKIGTNTRVSLLQKFVNRMFLNLETDLHKITTFRKFDCTSGMI